jgi:hypothetical protein
MISSRRISLPVFLRLSLPTRRIWTTRNWWASTVAHQFLLIWSVDFNNRTDAHGCSAAESRWHLNHRGCCGSTLLLTLIMGSFAQREYAIRAFSPSFDRNSDHLFNKFLDSHEILFYLECFFSLPLSVITHPFCCNVRVSIAPN